MEKNPRRSIKKKTAERLEISKSNICCKLRVWIQHNFSVGSTTPNRSDIKSLWKKHFIVCMMRFSRYNSSRPHIRRATQEKILDIRRSVLPHPPYSLYFGPKNFHYFYFLQNFLYVKTSNPDEEVKQEGLGRMAASRMV